MRIPTPEQRGEFGSVMVTWEFWIIVYRAITMFSELIIIGIIAIFNNKSTVKIIK